MALFPGKFIFAQSWAKRAQNGPKVRFFRFFERFCPAGLARYPPNCVILEIYVFGSFILTGR